MQSFPVVIATVLFVMVALVIARRSLVIARPDEWLIRIRNGKLVGSGVGVYLWRRPRDVVARFTSTMQRVSFAVEAISKDRLRVSIEGFLLWSVSAEGDGPFRAFQKLGVVNLDDPPRDLKSPKHLLSTPQHRAFQQLLGAQVQRIAAARTLEELLVRQDPLVAALKEHLETLEREIGIRIDQIEILRVRPVSEEILRQMSAEVEERLREDAARIKASAGERAKRLEIESGARVAHEHAEARRQELERNKELKLLQLTHEREVKSREEAALREQAMAEEARLSEVAAAARERREADLAVELDQVRRRAEANRDAILSLVSAEETKSQPVRDHELSRLLAEKVADALKQLPIRDARWITVGPDSPMASLAKLFTAAREVASEGPKN